METLMNDVINQHKKIVTDLRERVEHDYDGLIEELRINNELVLVADTPHLKSQLSIPLWTVDDQFHSLTTSMRHPTREFVDIHKRVIDIMQEPIKAMNNTPSFDPVLAQEINEEMAFVSSGIQTIKNIFD